VRHCWTAGNRANVDSYMRTLLDFLVGHFFLVRGEQRRVAELADMFVMQLPTESASQECWCWVIVFDNGKTNSSGKKQYLGALRNRDFRICVISWTEQCVAELGIPCAVTQPHWRHRQRSSTY